MPTLARPLRVFRDDNLNITWPLRPRSWDGWIGDSSHQQRESDHNPNMRGIVDALDIDATGIIHVPTVIASALRHSACHYIIHRRRIMTSSAQYMPRAYTGTNPHDHHIHFSINQSKAAENSSTGFRFILKPMAWAELKLKAHSNSVGDLQAYLNGYGYAVRIDNDFGPQTDVAVRAFQKAKNIKVDGIVGPATRHQLRPFA